jgi:hypothetical protein
VELRWRQLGVLDVMADPQLPFFVQWSGDTQEHPSTGGGRVRLERLEMCGEAAVITDYLGADPLVPLDGIDVEWVDAEDPGIVAAWFATGHGPVRID